MRAIATKKHKTQISTLAEISITSFADNSLTQATLGWLTAYEKFQKQPRILPLRCAQRQDDSAGMMPKGLIPSMRKSFFDDHHRFLTASHGLHRQEDANPGRSANVRSLSHMMVYSKYVAVVVSVS